jgi:hypothetical protein
VDTYLQTAIEEALAAEALEGPARPLPFILAGPVVRRAEPDGVWIWFACSREITSCTPRVTVYDSTGRVNDTLANDNGWYPLVPKPGLRVARLGERLWVAMVKAQPRSRPFPRGWFYGYELTIGSRDFTTTLAGQNLNLAYAPFRLPTFVLGLDGQRLVHGSCRRPGAPGPDAYPAFEAWLTTPQRDPMFSDGRTFRPIADTTRRPTALILTGDQIYADDVALPLFRAVQRLARDVFGYAEQLPTWDGRGTVSVDTYLPPYESAPPAPGSGSRATPAPDPTPERRRKWLTSRPRSPIGFTTDDGEGHLLSFPEFAAMYLLVLNEQLCRDYGVEDKTVAELAGFPAAVGASRRVLANMATYMVFDDHEITDDWNLDEAWVRGTSNPMARRIIANGLAAYWAFQGWGNDPEQFEPLKDAVVAQLAAMRGAAGRPGPPATAFDRELLARHWSFVAPTSPAALCVDTRTSREFPPGKTAVLSGPKVQPYLTSLARRHGLRKGAALLIVLPTPLLAHRSMTFIQARKYSWPKERYEGDYELYINNPRQRSDLIRYLRSELDPPAVIVFSGDVHHGSVVSGLYVGAPNRVAIDTGKGTWGLRVAQITSSPIKNVKKDAYVDKKLIITDAGNVGESVISQFETLYDEPPGGEAVGVRADAVKLDGPLGRRTFVWENHLCVVDVPEVAGGDVKVLFVGNKGGSVRTATTTVSTRNDPRTFVPSPATQLKQQPPRLPRAAEVSYMRTAIEDAMEVAWAASGGPAADAIRVRDHIKATAQARAKLARSVPISSRFYKRLVGYYLKDYLAAPSAPKGKTAAEARIGKQFAGPATAGDKWEEGALGAWNKQPIPAFARRVRPLLPAELAAATDILSVANRASLAYIDVPQLVGKPNTALHFDADWELGGKNISQLMHWATGVKYSDIDKLTMRELFLAYELWHLETWDVFGEDPINDLISEEAGRILGTQLRAGSVTAANLRAKLDEGFEEARGWVGSLLRARRAELDAWIVAESQKKARIWYGKGGEEYVWGTETIHGKLKAGASVEDVKRSTLVERIIDIYALVYEADLWEAAHGKIDNGSFIPTMLSGSMDAVFERLAKDQPVLTLAATATATAPVAVEGERYASAGRARATVAHAGATATVPWAGATATVLEPGAGGGDGGSERHAAVRELVRNAQRVGAAALALVPAGEADVAAVALLADHHDVGPDMILRWNEIADLSAGIDVVVHLHGFSSDRRLDLRRRKLGISGLDFVPPPVPPDGDVPAQPAWTGRRRPTLLILPRGRARPGHPAAYDFPALVRPNAFIQLVDAALREFEARTGIGRRVAARRVVLTAHSGGGAALDAILPHTAGTPLDPHEVHAFDALYGRPSGLRGWVDRRLRRDVERLRAGVADPAGWLAGDGGALRILYLHGNERATTRPGSLAVQAAAHDLIPRRTAYTGLLERRYRAEVARIGHALIPYWYGGRLLAEVTAEVPGP